MYMNGIEKLTQQITADAQVEIDAILADKSLSKADKIARVSAIEAEIAQL